MADKLGADFNPNDPSDDDLVKHGASWIRDTRRRLRNFVDVLFDRETGLLKEGLVDSDALKDLEPSPAGTYNQVTVNAKGLVTDGEMVEIQASANLSRYLYLPVAGFDPAGEQIEGTLAADENGLTVYSYSFTVPDGVTRFLVRVQGSGGGGSASAGGGGGGYAETIVQAAPGDVWLVWVGQGGQGELAGTPQNGGTTKFQFDPSKWVKAAGGQAASGSTAGIGYQPANSNLVGVLAWFGGTGGATLGGGAGDGSPAVQGNYGWGGFSTGGGQSGGNGYVIVEYWL